MPHNGGMLLSAFLLCADAGASAPLRWRRFNPIAGLPQEAVIAGHNGEDSVVVCRLRGDDGRAHVGWVMIRDALKRCYALDDSEALVRADTFDVLVHATQSSTPPADRTRWGSGEPTEIAGFSVCRCGEDNLDLWVGQRRGGVCEGVSPSEGPLREAANKCDVLLQPAG